MRAAGSPMPDAYDVIIIGAGHNGLVTAAYLARAGLAVLVLERRELVGGACVTEELWPGYRVSTASYVNSLLRPEIVRELELKRHGFEMLPRSPSSFTPFPDGRYLMLGPEAELNRREISKFSARDAEALPRYEAMLERIAAFIEPTLLETPPDPWSGRMRDLWQHGAEIRVNAPVARILVQSGQVHGVVLADGTDIRAARVASNADAAVTFLKLIDPSDLPTDFAASVRAIDYTSSSLKINVALSQ